MWVDNGQIHDSIKSIQWLLGVRRVRNLTVSNSVRFTNYSWEAAKASGDFPLREPSILISRLVGDVYMRAIYMLTKWRVCEAAWTTESVRAPADVGLPKKRVYEIKWLKKKILICTFHKFVQCRRAGDCDGARRAVSFWIRKVNCTLDGLRFTRRRYRRCVTGAAGECQVRIFPEGFTAMGADSGPCRSHPASVIPSVTIEDKKNIVAPARQILFTAQYFLSKTNDNNRQIATTKLNV